MYTIGDVVTLNSGGPEMTVATTKEEGIFEVVYFDSTGKLQINNFYGACLHKVPNNQGRRRIQTLPSRANVQIGLPLTDINIKTKHFKNFINHWYKVLNSSEYVENKVTYAYIQDKVHLIIFDRDLTDFNISRYEGVIKNEFDNFKEIFNVYPKLYSDGEEHDFIVPVMQLVAPLEDTWFDVKDNDLPFGISVEYDLDKNKLIATSDVYVWCKKQYDANGKQVLVFDVDRDKAEQSLNLKTSDNLKAWTTKIKLDFYE